MSTASPWIKDVTDETFEKDVLEVSKSRPVVVDFWAEWCQPCLALKPMLEQQAVARDGSFLLAKCNTNETPQRAREFGVQGIPAVYAVFEGEVIDFFNGLLPQHALEQWLDGLDARQSLSEAQKLESSDPEAAETIYCKLLDDREDNVEARIGLARALLAMNEEEACRDEIAKLERRGFSEPEAEKVLAQLKLYEQKDVDISAVQTAAEANPDNLEAQVAWADALAGHDRHTDALEKLLHVIQQQKDGVGETARDKMLDIFKVLGDDHELTRDFRRKLSAVLF